MVLYIFMHYVIFNWDEILQVKYVLLKKNGQNEG